MVEILNTIKHHEVLVEPRTASKQRPLHPAAPRRPGQANKTDAISWSDRKKLTIECIKHELEELRMLEQGEDGAEKRTDDSKFPLL